MADSIRKQIIDAVDAQFKLIGIYGLGEGPLGEGFLGGDLGESLHQQIIGTIDVTLYSIVLPGTHNSIRQRIIDTIDTQLKTIT